MTYTFPNGGMWTPAQTIVFDTGTTSTKDYGKRAQALPNELRRFVVKQVRATKSEKDNATDIDIEGYASITDTAYEVEDFMGAYQETIRSGAFAKTLKEKDDVRLLFNHDGIPLARTKSGTLVLDEDKQGLKVNATLDSRSGISNDVLVAVERGDLDEMSFAFKVTRQEWNEDYTERWINELKLFDVSIVTYPANPATSVKMRAVDFLLNNLSDEDVRDLMERYAHSGASSNAKKLALRRRQLARLDLA